MTLFNKIFQVSQAQFYNTSSIYLLSCVFTNTSQVSVHAIHHPYTLLHLPPPPPLQSLHCCLCPGDFSLSLFCLIPSLSEALSPANSHQPIRLILKQEWSRLNMKNFHVTENHHNICPLLKMIYSLTAIRKLGHSLLETNLEVGVGIYILVIFKWFVLSYFRTCILL